MYLCCEHCKYEHENTHGTACRKDCAEGKTPVAA